MIYFDLSGSKNIIKLYFKSSMKSISKNLLLTLFIFLVLILGFFFIRWSKWLEYNFIFSYPDPEKLNFAGEKVPILWKNFSVKERFDREYVINSNTLYQFFLYIKRYPKYIPYIENELKENDIPDDFKYLAIAESALKEDAISSAWANGIWQFMPETAKSYWLQVDKFVDERNNFEKSTQAAIKHLKKLYKIFWNWTLVAAAYNRWENGIKRDLNDQKVDSYYDLYLNEETSRYVFRILAIKYLVEEYQSKKAIFDIFIGSPYTLPEIKTVKVNKIDDIIIFAQEYKQTYATLKNLNPWIISTSLPEWEWFIKILKE